MIAMPGQSLFPASGAAKAAASAPPPAAKEAAAQGEVPGYSAPSHPTPPPVYNDNVISGSVMGEPYGNTSRSSTGEYGGGHVYSPSAPPTPTQGEGGGASGGFVGGGQAAASAPAAQVPSAPAAQVPTVPVPVPAAAKAAPVMKAPSTAPLQGFSTADAEAAGYAVLNDSSAKGGKLLEKGNAIYDIYGNKLYKASPAYSPTPQYTAPAAGAGPSGILYSDFGKNAEISFTTPTKYAGSFVNNGQAYNFQGTLPTTYEFKSQLEKQNAAVDAAYGFVSSLDIPQQPQNSAKLPITINLDTGTIKGGGYYVSSYTAPNTYPFYQTYSPISSAGKYTQPADNLQPPQTTVYSSLSKNPQMHYTSDQSLSGIGRQLVPIELPNNTISFTPSMDNNNKLPDIFNTIGTAGRNFNRFINTVLPFSPTQSQEANISKAVGYSGAGPQSIGQQSAATALGGPYALYNFATGTAPHLITEAYSPINQVALGTGAALATDPALQQSVGTAFLNQYGIPSTEATRAALVVSLVTPIAPLIEAAYTSFLNSPQGVAAVHDTQITGRTSSTNPAIAYSNAINQPSAIQQLFPGYYASSLAATQNYINRLDQYQSQNKGYAPAIASGVPLALAQNLYNANVNTDPITKTILAIQNAITIPGAIVNPEAAFGGAALFGAASGVGILGENAVFGKPTSPQALSQSIGQGAAGGLALGPSFEALAPALSGLPGLKTLAGNPFLQEAGSTAGSVGITNAASLLMGNGLATPQQSAYAAIQGASFPLLYGLASNINAELQIVTGDASETIPAGTTIGKNGNQVPVFYSISKDGLPIRIVADVTENPADINSLRAEYEGKTLPYAIHVSRNSEAFSPLSEGGKVELTGSAKGSSGIRLKNKLFPFYSAPPLRVNDVAEISDELNAIAKTNPTAAQKVIDYINAGNKYLPTLYGGYIGIGNPEESAAAAVGRIDPRAVIMKNVEVSPEFAPEPGESSSDYYKRVLALEGKTGIGAENYQGTSSERQLETTTKYNRNGQELPGSTLQGEGKLSKLLVRQPPEGLAGKIPVIKQVFTRNTYVPSSLASIAPSAPTSASPDNLPYSAPASTEAIQYSSPSSAAIVSPQQIIGSVSPLSYKSPPSPSAPVAYSGAYDPLTSQAQMALYQSAIGNPQAAQQIVSSLQENAASQSYQSYLDNLYRNELGSAYASSAVPSSAVRYSPSNLSGFYGSQAYENSQYGSPASASYLSYLESLSPSQLSSLAYPSSAMSPSPYQYSSSPSPSASALYPYYYSTPNSKGRKQPGPVVPPYGAQVLDARLQALYPTTRTMPFQSYQPSLISLVAPGLEKQIEANYNPLLSGIAARPLVRPGTRRMAYA